MCSNTAVCIPPTVQFQGSSNRGQPRCSVLLEHVVIFLGLTLALPKEGPMLSIRPHFYVPKGGRALG